MRISRLLTPLAAAILLAGCATSDPYGGQTQRSSTAMGTGIGRALIHAVIDAASERDCDRVRLEVRASNESAIALYSRAGFVPFDRKVAYYEDGEDAVRMERILTSTQEQKA